MLKILRRLRSVPVQIAKLDRPFPHGLVGWRIWFGWGDPRIRAHRRATMAMRHPWPRAAWVVIQILLARRWRRKYAAAVTNATVARFGPEVERSEGIALEDQRRIVLDLARRYCIPPINVYDYRIYRRPETALDYVFGSENLGAHRAINRSSGGPSHELLQDKVAFQEFAVKRDWPMPPLVATIPQGTSANLRDLARHEAGGVFVKGRKGWDSQGAFSLTPGEPLPSGQMMQTTGRLASWSDAQAALDALLQNDDALVQKLLQPHDLFQKATVAGDPPVVRVVTRRSGLRAGADAILCGYLKIPLLPVAGERTRVVMRIEEDGRLTSLGDPSPRVMGPALRLAAAAVIPLGEGARVPFWSAIRDVSLEAQGTLPDLWSVGWDWFVSKDGPVLLEGNVYWDFEAPQWVRGGLAHLVGEAL